MIRIPGACRGGAAPAKSAKNAKSAKSAKATGGRGRSLRPPRGSPRPRSPGFRMSPPSRIVALRCRGSVRIQSRSVAQEMRLEKRSESCMQTQAAVAEQTSRNRYHWPEPVPSREIELTLRLEIPDDDRADVGIYSRFADPLPPEWNDALHQRLCQGVHGGLASVEAPIPDGGIGVYVTHLRFRPPLGTRTSASDVQRLGDALEALTAATVAALWNGLISFDAPLAP